MSLNANEFGPTGVGQKRLKAGDGLSDWANTPGDEMPDEEFIFDSAPAGSINNETVQKELIKLRSENSELKRENLNLTNANKRLSATLANQQTQILQLQEEFSKMKRSTDEKLIRIIDERIKTALGSYKKNETVNVKETETKKQSYAAITSSIRPERRPRQTMNKKTQKAKKALDNLSDEHSFDEIRDIGINMLNGYDPLNRTPLKARPAAIKRMQRDCKLYKNEKLLEEANNTQTLFLEGIKRNSFSLIKKIFEKMGIEKSELRHLSFIGPTRLLVMCDHSATPKFLKVCSGKNALKLYLPGEIPVDDFIKITKMQIQKPTRLDCAVALQLLLPDARKSEIFPASNPTITSEADVMETN